MEIEIPFFKMGREVMVETNCSKVNSSLLMH